MTDAERDSKLVLSAEAALAAAPLREPNWDALTARIERALASSEPSDDSLLLPPLPESIEDGREDVGVATAPKREPETKGPESQRGDASLAELARAAVARRSSKEAVSLVKESLAIASQGRTQAEPAPPAASTPVPAALAGARERPTVPPSRREPASLDTRGPWIGVAIAAVGLAAGFGLYLASRQTPASVTAVVAAAPPPSAAAVAELTPPRKITADAPPAPPAAPLEEKQAAALPLPAADRTPVAALARESAPVVKPPVAEARASAAATAARPHAEKVVLEEETPAIPTGHAKPAASAMRPAELNATSGGMSDRPSTGAAQAAVGAVLGAARSCIAGQPEASSATLVFGSSGEVTSVNVSGPAAGTPAASCIKAALGKARVQPFAAPSFSLGVTVRPL